MVDIVRLGALANPADYPSRSEIRAKFDAKINFFPIPSTNDFRIDVSEEDKAEMAKAIKDAEAGVAKYLVKELLAPVKRFVDKLSVPIGEDGSVFRDTLVDNIVELVERLPALNIANDPDVEMIISGLRTVTDTFSADHLRDSPVMRDRARQQMAQIQSQMAAFMGG